MIIRLRELDGKAALSMFFIERPREVIPGSQITKDVRQRLLGVDTVSGSSSMKCENSQRGMIEQGTGFPCPKSGNVRINTETNEIRSITNPYSGPNGDYDWTEDFDGVQNFPGCVVFYNFKSIVQDGGAQTRSLKCVYDFVKAQRNVIRSRNVDKTTLFVNILDGQFCDKHMNKFSRFEDESQIYVGDMYNYFDWLRSRLETIL